jgi:hypothetical protein
MLHSVLLGTFKCLLSIFYEMLGESSQKAKAIDALASYIAASLPKDQTEACQMLILARESEEEVK